MNLGNAFFSMWLNIRYEKQNTYVKNAEINLSNVEVYSVSRKCSLVIKKLTVVYNNDTIKLLQCSASCDGQGVKYRVLQCVWYGTRKPAGSACAVKPRPPLMKACKGPPCPKSGTYLTFDFY